MTWKPRWWIRVWTAIGIACVIGAGITFATIPDDSGVIHGCYTKSTGTIRVIDSAATNCKAGETVLTWNTTGPMGPAGPAGVAGPSGPAGQQGEPGDDNVIAFGVSGPSATKTVTVTDLGDVTVACSADGVATGGFTTPHSVQYKGEFTRSDGTSFFDYGEVTGGILFTTNPAADFNATYRLNKPGIGIWKVEFNSSQILTAHGVQLECVSTVVVTAMQ